MQKKNIIRITSLLFVLLIVYVQLSIAQENGSFAICPDSMTEEACKKSIEYLSSKSAQDVRPDFFVPDSPAFSVLGVTPETTIRPESTRDFAISLLNGIDPRGNMQSGIAIDTSPYLLTGVDLSDYRKDPFERFLSRTQLSIATTKGSSDNDKSIRASIGLRLTLFDKGDPRLDTNLDSVFYNSVKTSRVQEDIKLVEMSDKLEKIAIEYKKAELGGNESRMKELKNAIEEIEKEREELENLTEKDLQEQWIAVLKKYDKGQWNATSATIGFAPIFFSEDGGYDNINGKGYTLYGTLSYGFDQFGELPAKEGAGNWLKKNAHLLFHIRYSADQEEALDDGSGFREQDTTILGAQLRFLGPKIWSNKKGDDLAFALETDYILKDFENGEDDEKFRYTGVIELKPLKNSGFTLKVAVGGENGGDQDDEGFVVTSINWSFD